MAPPGSYTIRSRIVRRPKIRHSSSNFSRRKESSKICNIPDSIGNQSHRIIIQFGFYHFYHFHDNRQVYCIFRTENN